jgi:hypothetical protein
MGMIMCMAIKKEEKQKKHLNFIKKYLILIV